MHNHVGNYHMTIGDLKLFSIEFINRLILTVSGKIPLEDVHILDIIDLFCIGSTFLGFIIILIDSILQWILDFIVAFKELIDAIFKK